MRLVRLLPERWQKLIREMAKFGIVGGINFGINFAVFNILALTVLPNGELKANVIATVVATTTSYLMNRHWTYRDRPTSSMRREYLLFFFFNAAGLAIELSVLALAKYGLGITGLLALNAAKVVGQAIGTVFRFWSYRTFVFRKAPAGHADALHVDPHTVAELDLAAELAEAVAELEDDAESTTAESVDRPTATVPPQQRVDEHSHRIHVDPTLGRTSAAKSIDLELEAELAAAELDAAHRPAAR